VSIKIKKTTFKAVSILFIFLLMSVVTKVNAGIEPVTIDQAKQLYDNGALFIDTRSYIERAFGVVKGSIAINKNEVTEKLSLLPKDKTKALVVYCARGVRAAVAADNLDNQGYLNIYVVSDVGFGAWKGAGYPVE
jgi:rhodanese-related sulfurtransferase